MAISVDWPTGVISVPKADTVLIGTDPISGREIRTFDTVQFHVDLRILQDTVDGRVWPRTHGYSETQFAPDLTMTSYFTVEFEDGTYRVSLIKTNNNIADVSVINQVSIQPNNSAGLIEGGSGGFTAGDKETLININEKVGV